MNLPYFNFHLIFTLFLLFFHTGIFCQWLCHGFMFFFLLSVFHVITSCSALGVKELMLQFHALLIFPDTWFSEMKKNYISQKTSLFCFHLPFRGKDKTAHESRDFPFFYYRLCSVRSLTISPSPLE